MMVTILLLIGFFVGAFTVAGLLALFKKIRPWDIVIGLLLASILLQDALYRYDWGAK